MVLSGKKILLVDDEVALRRMLGIVLQQQGAIIEEAGNGAEGLRKATLNKPDLIVMDLMMPDVNGFEAIRSLRMLMEDRPILVLTGFATEENIEEARESGANLCLGKPLNQARFVQTILGFLNPPPSP